LHLSGNPLNPAIINDDDVKAQNRAAPKKEGESHMLTSMDDLSEYGPNIMHCRTERLANNLSKCLTNNSLCDYGLTAGPTKTYCMHPNRQDFEYAAFMEPRGLGRVKTI
jgi:hypothetical protein